MRQPVDEVEIDVRHAGGTKPRDRALDHFGRLDPVDGGLDFRVEFLHAETGAVEAERPDLPDHLIGERTRIALDRDLGIGFELEALAQARHHGGKVPGLEHRWRPAAEMQVRNRHPSRQRGGDHVDFEKQVLNIGGYRRITRRQLHVAAAIPALLFAKRHVQIERDRLVGVEPAEPFAILACRKMRREMRRGGIAGVSGNVDLGVLFEGGRHRNFFQIGCQPRSNSRPVGC